MKIWKTLCLLALAAVLALGLAAAEAENLPGPDPDKKVDSIEVYQLPSKTAYVVGDTFTAEGGILKILYKDGAEAYIAMTDEAVTIKAPTMNTVNTKNVQVKYGGAKVVFKVEVAAGVCDVAFDLNYDGAPDPERVQVSKNSKVQEIDAPVREGFDFVAWYADPDFTRLYDFDAPVTQDTTIYAFWLRRGAETVTVTFDYDYYGILMNSYAYPVETGACVQAPAAAPERVGYAFSAWVDEAGQPFDFSRPVTADTVIRAAWEKTVSGPQTWVFEAEDTDLTGKIGPSYSGSALEESMILYNDSIGASGDRLVGFLYEQGVSLEFWIASDEDVADARIALSIAGEYVTMSYDGNDFQVLVNGTPKNYPRVTIEIDNAAAVADCEDRIVLEGVALRKGENLIQLKTNNTTEVPGTTFKAHAPMVDCVKITTSAVLIWDENHGEPALKNYKK